MAEATRKQSDAPRLQGLVLLGLTLVVLPLVAALLTATVQVRRLAADSEAGLIAMQAGTVASRTLVERGVAMERNARQYRALGDAALLGLYDENAQAVLDALATLAHPGASAGLVNAATRARIRIDALRSQLAGPLPAPAGPAWEAELEAVRADIAEVVREQGAATRELAAAFPEQARSLQRLLGGIATLVLPVSVLVMAWLSWRVVTPLRHIGQGIQALGRGALAQPIAVRGARDLEALGERLEWLRLRLLALEGQKSAFLRNVSHELKTPLTNIREGAELLQETGGAAAERERVARIVRDNSLRLQGMIETLLRYGAEGDLGPGVAPGPVPLDRLVRRMLEHHADSAGQRGVRLEAQLAALTVPGNARHLEVIVDNLLSNAVRHSPPGGAVRLRLERAAGQVRLDVADEGPGVPEADRERVFDWFWSGPRPPGTLVAGSGMGLAIAREFAVRMGGRLELLPASPGAHFRLELGALPP